MKYSYYNNLRRVYLQRGCSQMCGQSIWEPQEIVQEPREADTVTIPSPERQRERVVPGTQMERGFM